MNKNNFSKDTRFDITGGLVEFDFGADADSHGNVRIGELLQCADGTYRTYSEFEKFRENEIVREAAQNMGVVERVVSYVTGSYDLGNLDSPLQLVCDTQASVSSPQR